MREKKITKQYLFGFDEDGTTDISLKALKEIQEIGAILEKVEIAKNNDGGTITSFVFKDYGVYNASGFNIGYGGEGPHGLHTAICYFHPDKITKDFWKTPISSLDTKKRWIWKPTQGFLCDN